MPRPTFPALLLALSLAVPASTAVAADPMPVPDCHGQIAKDAEGDSANSTAGTGSGVPSSDLTGGWITFDPATGKAQANIQVVNLTASEIDAPYTAISWEMGFTAAKTFTVRGYQDRTGMVLYTWGEPRAVTDDQTAPRMGGNTTGKLFPGKGGVIQVDIPLADMGIKPGDALKAITLEVRQWAGKPAAVPNPPPSVPLYQVAPIYDQASGKGQVVLGPCATPAPPATPAPDVTPTTGPAILALKVKAPKTSARKANKAKKLTFGLTGTASNLVAALKTGTDPVKGKVVAKGKLASVNGSGKLVVKLSKKLKKGKYTLYVTGKNADGKAAEGAATVRVK